MSDPRSASDGDAGEVEALGADPDFPTTDHDPEPDHLPSVDGEDEDDDDVDVADLP